MKAKKISGGSHHFPAVGRDVEEGETIDVPDGTVLPAEHFEQVQDKPAAKSSSKE